MSRLSYILVRQCILWKLVCGASCDASTEAGILKILVCGASCDARTEAGILKLPRVSQKLNFAMLIAFLLNLWNSVSLAINKTNLTFCQYRLHKWTLLIEKTLIHESCKPPEKSGLTWVLISRVQSIPVLHQQITANYVCSFSGIAHFTQYFNRFQRPTHSPSCQCAQRFLHSRL